MEYILVLLIVALLNGAIAYIDGLMEGIVPLTLYAEQYMSTLAGVDLFEALFDIVFGFGVSLIILKFLKKGFETYVLWSDGDADEEPIALLTNFFKAMAVAVCFPTMYGWLAGIVEEMSDKMLEAIGLATAYDWAGWVSGISTLGLVTAIFGLVFVIVYFILYFQFLMRGLEILILRVGMPLACVGLIDNDKGVFKPYMNKFQSPQHAVDVVRRLLHKSGMILDNSQPGVVGHLSNKIRITVLGNPLTDKDKGVAASIRIVNPKKLGRDDFVRYGTATAEMLDFLAAVLRFGLSVCVTGSTGSGKTTLMSWILSTIPNEKRVFTIENGCREFDLVKEDAEGNVLNNVVHTVTRFSDDPKQNYDQERLLEFALTCDPDVVCVGEMKSAEAFAAQEAARTGHAVITTTHANSCKATYYRMVTLCTQKYDMGDKTLYNLVTEAFPIVLFVKKLEDNSRRVMEITECEILEDGTRQLHTLYRYHVSETAVEDGKVKVHGEFQKMSPISASLQKRLLENGMPPRLLEQIAGGRLNIDDGKEKTA